MSYVPAGSTPAQLNTFARRLSLHLARPEQRSSWMAFQQSLARAAGYPDAHAAQQAQKRSLAFLRPFSQSVDVRPAPLRLPVLPGASAHRLAKWTKALWKQGADNQSLDIRQRLALAWGHQNWADLLTACLRQGSLNSRSNFQQPWLRAKNCEVLASLAKTYGDNAEWCGLHTVLGQAANGDWLGLNTDMAMCHTVVCSKNAAQRQRLANAWAGQRIMAGDRMVVFSGTDATEKSLLALARSCGREQETRIFDWTRQGSAFPCEIPRSSSSITHWLITCLKDPSDPLSNDLISWISYVSLSWAINRPLESASYPWKSLIAALIDPGYFPPDWWALANSKQHQALTWPDIQRIHQTLPPLWEVWSRRLEALGSWFDESSATEAPSAILLGRLPSDSSCFSQSVMRAVTSCLSINVTRKLFHVSTDTKPPATENLPGLIMSVDLPLGWGWASAVLPAQARSLHYANVSVMNEEELTSSFTRPGSEIVRSWLANAATTIVLGSEVPAIFQESGKGGNWKSTSPVGQQETDGAWVVARGEVERINVAMDEISVPSTDQRS